MIFMKETKIPLWKQMLIGMVLGILVGLVLSPHGADLLNEKLALSVAEWLALPGALFLALIKMVVIPLVVCSITLAVTGSTDITRLKNTGIKVGLYFVSTTTIAVSIGIALVSLIQPGQYIDPSLILTEEVMKKGMMLPSVESRPSLPNMFIGLLPTNPVKAVVDYSMLQIVIASIISGIALLSLPKKKAKPITDLLQSGLDVSMQIVLWTMKIAPLAVFGFLSTLTIKLGPDTLVAMSAYVGTVLIGLLCVLVIYMIILEVFAKRCPWTFLRQIRDAQVLAFSSSSSAATMPLSLKVADEKLKIRKEISGFVIPMGTTINMDGTAIYQVIAGLFLTQVFGIDLSFAETILLAVTIIGASIGSPGSPGVGLVILATILTNIGVSPEGVAMILGVDRLLDMCRTTINVTGDLTASAVMDRWVKK